MFWQISCLDRERGGEGRGVQVAVSATIENEDLEYTCSKCQNLWRSIGEEGEPGELGEGIERIRRSRIRRRRRKERSGRTR